MLRLMGGGFVLAGSAAAGWQLVTQRWRRMEEWCELLDACHLLERELRCREPALPALLETLSRHSSGPVRRHFAACRQGMEELGSRTFAAIWRESFTHSGLNLPRQERVFFLGLGDLLGRYDRETQCVALLRAVEESEERLHRAQRELQRHNKLYMTLSIAGGMLLVILAC